MTRRGLPRKRLVIDLVAAPWVRRVFAWYVADRVPIAEIVRRLNADPAAPPKSTKRVWTRGAVRKLLSNPRYRGHWRYGVTETVWVSSKDYARQVARREPLKDVQIEELRLVPDDRWPRAQALLAREAGRVAGCKPRDGDIASRPRVLNGLFHCPAHDRRLYAGGVHGRYMVCTDCRGLPADRRPGAAEVLTPQLGGRTDRRALPHPRRLGALTTRTPAGPYLANRPWAHAGAHGRFSFPPPTPSGRRPTTPRPPHQGDLFLLGVASMIAPDTAAQAAFLSVFHRVERHARVVFGFLNPSDREEAAAEAVARARAAFLRLRARRPSPFFRSPDRRCDTSRCSSSTTTAAGSPTRSRPTTAPPSAGCSSRGCRAARPAITSSGSTACRPRPTRSSAMATVFSLSPVKIEGAAA